MSLVREIVNVTTSFTKSVIVAVSFAESVIVSVLTIWPPIRTPLNTISGDSIYSISNQSMYLIGEINSNSYKVNVLFKPTSIVEVLFSV